ncbi:MAG: hypothetical protein ACP5N7_05275 [Candidatus Pacearchaeota archaeon]
MLGVPAHCYIDSDYRISGTSHDFTAKLNLPTDFDYDSVSLLQASIPKSYYLVREPFNTFILQENKTNEVTITVQPGNYSLSSFKNIIKTLLNDNSPNNLTYNLTSPNINTECSTGKITYTVEANILITSQPALIFPYSSNLYKQFGFESESTNYFVNRSLTSVNVVNFNTINGLIILSDLVEGTPADPIHGSAVLQEIFSFNTFDYSNINFQNIDIQATAKLLNKRPSNTAHFTLTDLDAATLDLNGQPVNFSLVFFKRDRTNEMKRDDLKFKWYQDLINQSNEEQKINQEKQKPI